MDAKEIEQEIRSLSPKQLSSFSWFLKHMKDLECFLTEGANDRESLEKLSQEFLDESKYEAALIVLYKMQLQKSPATPNTPPAQPPR